MKKAVFALLALLSCHSAVCQETSCYDFLRLPVSAHAAALGGANITASDDDLTLMFSNPSLLSNASAKTVNLNYMTYMQGAKNLSAAYAMEVLTRGMVAVSAQMMDYGKMTQTDALGNHLGEFSSKDIALAGTFAYMLTDDISAGITARFISSSIADFHSVGVGIDAGLSYFNVENNWAVAITAKNLGGQLEAYDDDYESMPLDLQVGVSKRLIGTPLRFNLTFVELNHWDRKFIDHLALGADLLLPRSIWLGIGYNFLRARQMSIGVGDNESSHAAGLSLGAGINLDHFKLNLAWGKYHLASNSLVINVAYSL